MTADTGAAPPLLRPTHGTDAALRISVTGPDGTADLVVPFGSEVAQVAEAYAATVGAAQVPALALPGRLPLAADADADDVLDQGDLLVVVLDGPGAGGSRGADDGTGRGPSSAVSGHSRPAVLVLSAVVALAAAVAVGLAPGAASTSAWARPVAAGVLALGAALVALRSVRRGTAGGGAHAAAPALAAAAGFALAWSPGRGGALLALAVTGLAAAVVAALARTGADDEAGEQVLRIWITCGGGLAAVAVAWLLVGAAPLALAVVALAAVVLATRLLPSFVVDVDDDVLLDLDRLAVTAWSARDVPQGGRKRHQVRRSMVDDVVAHSRRAVVAGVVVTSITAAVAAPVVLLRGGPLGGDATTWAGIGCLALVGLAGAALGLAGRSFRSRLPRRLLGLSSCWLVLLAGGALAARLDGSWVWWSLAVLVLAVPGVVMAAVRLGHGWRSVWWARAGEVVETLCGVLVVALVPLASGLFDVIRTSFG